MRLLAPFALALIAFSCTSKDPASLCDRFFTPYPDHVSDRPRNTINAPLVDAMNFYANKEYEKAIAGLQYVLDRDAYNMTARMYMASAQLAIGDPYKAEMHLDFMENYKDRSFSDQVEWYNALCWLCEGDTARAAKQARWIASRPQTYRKEAQELAKAISNK